MICLHGKRITLLPSRGAGDFLLCPVGNEGSRCSTPLPVFSVAFVLDSVRLNSYEMYLTVDSLPLVVYSVGHLPEPCHWYFLFREVPAKVFGPFFKFNHGFCPIDFFLLILRLHISLISAPFSFLLFCYSEFHLLFLVKFPKVTSQVIDFGALLLSRICVCSCGVSETGFPRVIHLAGYIFISSVCLGSCFQMSSRNYFRNAMPKVLTAWSVFLMLSVGSSSPQCVWWPQILSWWMISRSSED